MSDHYTAEDMKAASEALIEMQGAHHVLTPKAILDAVAPAIAARAIREAARAVGHDDDCHGNPDRDPYIGCRCRLTHLYGYAARIERGAS